jgi:hypothetical protein
VEKKNPKCIGNCLTKIQPQCTQPPQKKGFKTHLKQKENLKIPASYQVGFSKFQPFT